MRKFLLLLLVAFTACRDEPETCGEFCDVLVDCYVELESIDESNYQRHYRSCLRDICQTKGLDEHEPLNHNPKVKKQTIECIEQSSCEEILIENKCS